MLKEQIKIILEIIILTIVLIVIVPICINGSKEYKEKREVLLNGTDTSVDITFHGDMKKLTIYSNHDSVVRVNLILKVNKLINDYEILLGNNRYLLNDLDSFSDEENCYYNLGIYEVEKEREMDFKLKVVDEITINETVTYSFITEGLFYESGKL